MEKAVKLNEAFYSFAQASKSLETYYEKLSHKVRYLTMELEKKNAQLSEAILNVKESKEYLQAVLQSIEEAIIVLDKDEKINMINKAAEKLLCIMLDDIRGKSLNELNFSLNIRSSGGILNVNDKQYDVIISRSLVSVPDGSVRGSVILIKDITRLKELERQNERNQRLISMGEMAAKIVHEIRSPLCSIELFSNMLSGDLRDTAHSEMANGISAGIKSLNNILTNMLLFAKPQKLTFTDINLSMAVEESLEMLIPLIEVRGIRLNRNLNDVMIKGDHELLKQVFMNIILNAVQAMPDGGQLTISSEQNSEFTTVSVSDEGEGISPVNFEKIFDPFFSTKDRGTGLGLAIAHKIIQRHNGFIKVFRNEITGSTFLICFPSINNMIEDLADEILIAEACK